jgi:hypothetical protein
MEARGEKPGVVGKNQRTRQIIVSGRTMSLLPPVLRLVNGMLAGVHLDWA